MRPRAAGREVDRPRLRRGGWQYVPSLSGELLACGLPYLITQKGMRSPCDPANRVEADAYFHRKRVFFRRLRRLQRQQDTAPAQPERAGKRAGASRTGSRIRPE